MLRGGSSAGRRSHGKSRTGCQTCKSRRIKCDEGRPACANCERHNVECDFIRPAIPPPAPSSLDVESLELLHNYATSTFTTLTDNLLLRDFYRINAVQLGLGCDYILRTMLSLSAFHLASNRPAMRDHYQTIATYHHQTAARDAMSLMTTDDLDPPTAEKLFLFSILTIFVALACPRKGGDGVALLVGESGFPEWTFLLRGTRAFSHVASSRTDGPVAPLLRHGADRWIAREGAGAGSSAGRTPSSSDGTACAGAAAGVHEYLDSMRSLISLRLQDDIALRDIYLSAIDGLHKSFYVVENVGNGNYDIVDAFIWVFEVADDFLPLLNQAPAPPPQEAVAVFAFFVVLLKRLDRHNWWLSGWADHLMAKSHSLLGEEHRLWIRWPLQETGWVQ